MKSDLILKIVMEVSGKYDVSLHEHGSFCHPCADDDRHVEADGFCQNCQEYLCEECCQHHRKVRVTKNHLILDKHTMPRAEAVKAPAAICTEKCERHLTEIVKFFCREHDAVGCGDCMIIGHKQCNVEHIQDVAKGFVTSTEYREIIATLQGMQTKVKETEEKFKRKAAEAETTIDLAIKEIHLFRQTIKEYLNKAEEQLKMRCEARKRDNEIAARKREKELESTKQNLKELLATLQRCEDNAADLFTEAKRISVSLKQLKNNVSRMDDQPIIERAKFTNNFDLKNMTEKQDCLGRLLFSRFFRIEGLNPEVAGSIRVTSTNDRTTPYISSMILTNYSEILCTDRSNRSLKIIDISKNELSNEISLSSGPWDITALEDSSRYATTLPDEKKIQLIRYKPHLSTEGCIPTDGKCRGIAYHEQKLIVSFESHAKVQILSLQGKVLLTFGDSGLFKWPGFVTVDHREDSFYVSDFQGDSVIKITIDGRVLDTYRGDDFVQPRGIFICEDALLCCHEGPTKCINRISPDCKTITTLSLDKHFSGGLHGVCLMEHDNQLSMFVSTNSDEQIYMYKMC